MSSRLGVALLLLALPAAAQSIFTVAGGNTNDGRAATFAALETPGSVAVDGSGNLYIADTGNNRIRRVSAQSGIMSTVAGTGTTGFGGDGGPATAATLAGPAAVTLDRAGNLYIADSRNNRVRRIAAGSGIISTIAGDGREGFFGDDRAATSTGLYDPQGLVVDAGGNVYIADTMNNRVRKVAAGTGIISTVAGNGEPEFSGDGGPATSAGLFYPGGVAVDAPGNLYIADSWNSRIRKVDWNSGVISTVAGTGGGCGGPPNPPCGYGGIATATSLSLPHGVAIDASGNLYIADTWNESVGKIAAGSAIISLVAGRGNQSFSGDGGPATAATLFYPTDMAVDSSGNVYIADSWNNRIRKVAVATGIISTVAGGYIADGGLATAATLLQVQGIALDAAGNLYVADGTDHRIRKIAAATGIISTAAGNGKKNFSGDGGAATAASLNTPEGVAVDSAGNLYIADSNNERIRRVAAATGIISTVAGNGAVGFSGDGGPATAAELYDPSGVAIDSSGNLYIADIGNNRIRKVAAGTGIISTIAGIGTQAFSGDGGPATAAALDSPAAVAIDASGNLYIADLQNARIRKIAAGSGIISTVAGNGTFGFSGDGGPATAAALQFHFTFFSGTGSEVAVDSAGNLYVVDGYSARLRKIAADTGIISTVAGNGSSGFSGDGGPAIAAAVNPVGITVDPSGNFFIADSGTNRIREVLACVTVQSPKLTQPADNSSSENISPKLAWSAVKGAFHYDVLLDTVNPPGNVIATDVTAATYSPSNLQPLTKYYWRVVAKGDPFCTPFSTAASGVSSFTTTSACASAAAANTAGAAVTGTSVQLSWTASARAAAYDVSLGASNPPRIYATGITGTTLTVDGLAAGTTYFWSVTAHASCDPAQTISTSVQSFATAGACAQPLPVTLLAPADNDNTVPATVNLSWNPSAGAAAYDLYLGNGSSPPLYMGDLAGTSVTLPRLSAGTSYTWRVVARAACNTSLSAQSPVRHFTVAACGAPQAVEITGAPRSGVAAGATYAIAWSDAVGLDGSGSYLVERATDAQFASILDRQETTATSASFISPASGTFYHRVTAIAACDRSRRSPASAAVAVNVVAGASVVIFTMQPQAVITKLGDRLEDQKTTFALENLGNAPVQVLVAPQLIGGSAPFFTIVDPFGGDPAAIALAPHEAHTFELHFSGPPNDMAASYQGSIYVTSLTQPLAFTPQAYVNLKVGGDTAAVAPKLLVNGVESGFAFFPPVSGDDSARPVITVDLLNSGGTPMEVAGEIGPEAWLKMEKDWNGSAVPPSSFRALRLSTQRTRALAGSALPRYTYLTVRNKSGQSARLLVEDAGGFSGAAGRRPPLKAGELSWIVPSVRSGSGGTSVLHLTNTGSSAAPVELVWTPEGADGFEDSAKRITLAIPPNDVVTLTDPLAQLFGAGGDSAGDIELRSTPERLGALVVRSEVRKEASGGAYGYSVPLAMRGEGARAGAAQRVAGLVSNAALKTSIVVCETSGRDTATVQLTLRDASGAPRGQQTFMLPRYGSKRIDDLGSDGGSIDLDVTAGGGTAFAFITVSDRTTGAGASIAAQPATSAASLSSLGRRIATNATSSRKWTVGAIEKDGTTTTAAGFVANASTTVTLTYRDDATGQSYTQNITAVTGQTRDFADVVQSLTNSAAASRGVLIIESDGDLVPYARVRSANAVDALPAVSQYSESLTGGGSSAPAYAEGLEQSLDAIRGRHTSLVLTEIEGRDANITLRLYEPGNRSTPIAAKNFVVPAQGELRFDDLFAFMGLLTTSDDLQQRRKDRVNVACVVTPNGGGTVQGVAIVTDNRTGDRRTIQLQPAGGAPATVPQRAAVSEPVRRRAVGR